MTGMTAAREAEACMQKKNHILEAAIKTTKVYDDDEQSVES